MKVSHEIFAINVVAGFNQTEAYLEAFPGCRSRGAARANASRLIARDNIKAEIARIRKENETSMMLSYREKREYLARVVRDPDSPPQAVIKALQVDNEMAGHNAPTEVHGEITLGAILQDLRSTPLVNPRPVAPLPIPAAGGGVGELPEQRTGEQVNGDEDKTDDVIVPALDRFRRRRT